MIKKPAHPLLGQMFKKIAPRIGARVIMDEEWQIVGQIIYKNRRKRYFRYSSLDLNPLGASDIAKDKDYANFFMKKMGYPTIPGKTFFSQKWAKAIGSSRTIEMAYRYAESLGLPVIVKPNSGSQGKGVAKVHNKIEFYRALKNIFESDKVALVQRLVTGKDYRIVVLDNKVISAYQRLPLSVVGDGRASIGQLLKRKQKDFSVSGRDTIIRMEDERIASNLKHQRLSMRSVPKLKEVVYLLDNANLSTGGDPIDVTKVMHPGFKKLAIGLTKDMGLRMCGVDLMIEGDIKDAPSKYWIIEVNAAPGLDHYVKTGKEQERIVEAMYLKVLKAMQ